MSIILFAVGGIAIVLWMLLLDNIEVICEIMDIDPADVPSWLYPKPEKKENPKIKRPTIRRY